MNDGDEKKQPTKPGQVVRSTSGAIGITTEEPMKRTPRIGVMFVGGRWAVNVALDELTVLDGWPASA